MHKFWNFSQSGIACDPIYVHKSMIEKLKFEFQKQVKRQYGVHPRTNTQVVPTISLTKDKLHFEMNNIDSPTNKIGLSDNESNLKKKKGDIDMPLIQDSEGSSSLITVIEFDTIETVISELRNLNPTAIHYYGATGSRSRKSLEEKVRSAYFILNDSPLQQCNVFAPFKHGYACGLGKIKGWEGMLA